MNNKFAVITGGSSGIGFELAKLLVKDEYNILIGGYSDRVFDAIDELKKINIKVDIDGIKTDLSTEEGITAFLSQIGNKSVDLLVLNAGRSLGGAFIEHPIETHLELLSLNITSILKISHSLLPDMIKKGSSKILLTSSLSATTPTPYEGIYGATKAFLSSFGNGLREELIGTGIQLTILHPGATATTFHDRAGMGETQFGDNSWKNDPAVVAQQGYQALLRGQTNVVGGDADTQRAWNENQILSEEEKARRFAESSKPNKKTK